MDQPDIAGTAERGEGPFPSRRALRAHRAAAEGAGAPSSTARTAVPSTGVEPSAPPGSATPTQDGPSEVRTGGPAREPLPGGRRDRRRQETARTALVADAGDHAARPRADGTANPFSVDGTVLVQQKALAARAAALTARARRIQDLSEQYRQGRGTPAPDDPASVHNLSIAVTPYVGAVPGGGTALVRAPVTSHLPVVGAGAGTAPAPRADATDSGGASQGAMSGRVPADTAPVEARTAFGLEPLDVVTAGLGRAGRLRLLQYSLLGVGGAALLTGIMMTVSSLNG